MFERVNGGVYECVKSVLCDRSMVGEVYEEDDIFEGFVWKSVKEVSRRDRLNKWKDVCGEMMCGVMMCGVMVCGIMMCGIMLWSRW